ncbi:MAG: ANL family adenylate-forming protein, partial [Acidimicrobiales bacterium]
RCLVTGTDVEVHDRFDPAAVDRAAADGATLVSLVTRALTQVRAEGFRRIIIGGAAPPPDRPPNVIATYGMTETGSGVVYDRSPLEGLELSIATPTDDSPRIDSPLDDSGSRDWGSGDSGSGDWGSGEVLLRGPMLFRRYRHEPEPFVDGWFPTGDIGRFDDGLLTILGRRDDAIVTGGEKMWPARAEAILGRLASVDEVALVGRPDPDWGHRVVAVVVPADPAKPPGLDVLQEAIVETLPLWYRPRDLEVRETLPKTSLGKIRRDEL